MATVLIDDNTAEDLKAQAAASGMTVEAYVKYLLTGPATSARPRLTLQELEALLSEHAFDGPTLPADFSHADIYGEHD